MKTGFVYDESCYFTVSFNIVARRRVTFGQLDCSMSKTFHLSATRPLQFQNKIVQLSKHLQDRKSSPLAST